MLATCDDMFVYRESIPAISSWNSKHPLPLGAAASTGSTWLHHSQICCREGEVLVTELWYGRLATIQWLCSHVTTANTTFSLRGLAAGLWAFRLQTFANVTQCRRRCVGHVCLRNPCLLQNLSLHSLPEAWASWEPRTFRHLCIKSWLHHAHPLVAAAEKTCHMQRSRGSGHGVVVPRIVTI